SLTGKCNDEGLRAAIEAEITLRDSPYDPWSEVEVVRTLGAMYTKGDNFMLGGRVVAEVDPIRFAPYAFLKWDMK
ncbi:MAG TPA: hypothetical protein P5285_05290, partial [Desulfomonilia bacterium]|nr:hypothetical protein [Desulfomonilia bacterium]